MFNIIEGVKKYSATDRIAVICLAEKITYAEVEQYSNILGNIFLEKSKSDTPILIIGNKDIYILPSMIAALKSGRAYVPIDTSMPKNRVMDIIDTVRPEIIIDLSDNQYDLNATINDKEKIQIINRDDLIAKINGGIGNKAYDVEIDEKLWVKDDQNSYILFTSGTTGKPKGVQISTYNLDSFISWISDVIGIDGSEINVMDQPSYSFDLSVSSLYPGIALGSTLYSIPSSLTIDFKKLFEEFSKSDIKVWVSTPSFAAMCLSDGSFNETMLPKMKSMLFIGEVLPVDVAKELYERFPNVEVVNGYGPTEATVGISQIVITKEHINSGKNLPVGIPMPNCKIRIVDEDMNDVEKGERGEIVIVGPSVSKGYYNNPEITKKSFYVEDESVFETKVDSKALRAYKTGDVGLISEDGNIVFFGRKDFQIKLNGYRIEIEDIENNIRKLDNISLAAVIPVKKGEEISYLKAYVVLKEKEKDASNLKMTMKIKKELGKLLPKYMIPRSFEIIDEMPLNTNNKIDRKKLVEMHEEV